MKSNVEKMMQKLDALDALVCERIRLLKEEMRSLALSVEIPIAGNVQWRKENKVWDFWRVGEEGLVRLMDTGREGRASFLVDLNYRLVTRGNNKIPITTLVFDYLVEQASRREDVLKKFKDA